MATINYTQSDNINEPGVISLDDESRTALSGPPNNGRLDNVGDLVFAEFDVVDGSTNKTVRVECIRTSGDTMTVRLVAVALIYYYYSESERVVENVPIEFS